MGRRVLVIQESVQTDLPAGLRALGYEVKVADTTQIGDHSLMEWSELVALCTSPSEARGIKTLGELHAADRSLFNRIAGLGAKWDAVLLESLANELDLCRHVLGYESDIAYKELELRPVKDGDFAGSHHGVHVALKH